MATCWGKIPKPPKKLTNPNLLKNIRARGRKKNQDP